MGRKSVGKTFHLVEDRAVSGSNHVQITTAVLQLCSAESETRPFSKPGSGVLRDG